MKDASKDSINYYKIVEGIIPTKFKKTEENIKNFQSKLLKRLLKFNL